MTEPTEEGTAVEIETTAATCPAPWEQAWTLSRCLLVFHGDGAGAAPRDGAGGTATPGPVSGSRAGKWSLHPAWGRAAAARGLWWALLSAAAGMNQFLPGAAQPLVHSRAGRDSGSGVATTLCPWPHAPRPTAHQTWEELSQREPSPRPSSPSCPSPCPSSVCLSACPCSRVLRPARRCRWGCGPD